VAFPTNLLNDGEDIVLDLRPHWSRLAPPITVTVVLVLAGFASLFVTRQTETDLRIVTFAILAVLAVALIWLIRVYVKWTTTNFVVTTERLIHREGVVAKSGIEIPLDRVQTIKFHQSVFERMIGAGDLMIESAGETGQNLFSDVRKPSTVQNVIYREIEAYENRRVDRMGTAGTRAALSTAEQLEKLHGLLKSGALSQTEYDAQKARLLA
jgi:uncharacterized membrane protein YdbT with pleckstrin-like domain